MDKPSILEILMRADDRINFLLLRKGRDVIKTGPMHEYLANLPRPETTCPVQMALYRRAGIRMVRD